MLVVLDLLCATTTQAQVSVQLRDTVVKRGDAVQIPVRGIISASVGKLDSIRLVVRYTPSLLGLRSVEGGSTRTFQCPTPRVDSQFVSLSTGFLQISCNTLLKPQNPNDTTTLCVLNFATRAAADSIARVNVDSIFINGRPQVLLASRPATITVRGTPFAPIPIDNLSANYPNPVLLATTFAYSISETTPVRFTVFSLSGQIMTEIPELTRPPGTYVLELPVPATDYANGVFILRMTTNKGVFHQTFQIFR